MVAIEEYGIPVEPSALLAACMAGHLPTQIRPWKLLHKKTYKHYDSAVLSS
jgi:hypothetical protein